MRASARLGVVLLVAVGIVLMHGASADHDVMRISSLPAGPVMPHETSPQDAQRAAVAAAGGAMMTMNHAACVAVLRAPDAASHVPAAPTTVGAGDAQMSGSTAVVGDSHLPSRASPADLATELCISRT